MSVFIVDFCDPDPYVNLFVGIVASVSSPLYPENYPNNLECFWFISSTENFIITTFLHLEINEDILRFGVGNQSTPNSVVMEITGYQVRPNSLTIGSSLCWINIKTDEENSYPGFSLELQTSRKSGMLTSGVTSIIFSLLRKGDKAGTKKILGWQFSERMRCFCLFYAEIANFGLILSQL